MNKVLSYFGLDVHSEPYQLALATVAMESAKTLKDKKQAAMFLKKYNHQITRYNTWLRKQQQRGNFSSAISYEPLVPLYGTAQHFENKHDISGHASG